jgi:hypothetical protein
MSFAQIDEANKQPLAIRHIAALGEGHDLVHPVSQQELPAGGVFDG